MIGSSNMTTDTTDTIHEHHEASSGMSSMSMPLPPSFSTTSMSDDSTTSNNNIDTNTANDHTVIGGDIHHHHDHDHHPRRSEVLSTANKATTICDVCGHPVCSGHIMHNRDGTRELFVMCVDCSFDLTQLHKTLGVNHPQLQSNLDRLLQYYTRMVLQVSNK